MSRNSRHTSTDPMNELSLNPLFIDAAKEILDEEFSVGRLTETYLALDKCPHAKKEAARQFIYRNMLRLMKNGELEKHEGKQAWPVYKFTKKFNVHLSPVSYSTPPTKRAETRSSNRDVKARLRERLKVLKLEMLTAMGEVEEYSALENEVPGVRPAVQKLVDESRDRCSKLLGKVKAIETLLNA